jgi:hypothetical protein
VSQQELGCTCTWHAAAAHMQGCKLTGSHCQMIACKAGAWGQSRSITHRPGHPLAQPTSTCNMVPQAGRRPNAMRIPPWSCHVRLVYRSARHLWFRPSTFRQGQILIPPLLLKRTVFEVLEVSQGAPPLVQMPHPCHKALACDGSAAWYSTHGLLAASAIQLPAPCCIALAVLCV